MTPDEKNARARARYQEKKEELSARKRDLYAERRETILRRMREDRALCPLCQMPYRRLYLKKHLRTRHLNSSTSEVREAAAVAFPELVQGEVPQAPVVLQAVPVDAS